MMQTSRMDSGSRKPRFLFTGAGSSLGVANLSVGPAGGTGGGGWPGPGVSARGAPSCSVCGSRGGGGTEPGPGCGGDGGGWCGGGGGGWAGPPVGNRSVGRSVGGRPEGPWLPGGRPHVGEPSFGGPGGPGGCVTQPILPYRFEQSSSGYAALRCY